MRLALACAAIAFAVAVAWSIVTPPFEGPDEPQHAAYAQYVAEHGAPPPARPDRPAYSMEANRALGLTEFLSIHFNRDAKTPWTSAEQRRIQRGLDAPAKRGDGSGRSNTTSYSPLYYALAAIPYEAGSGGTFLDRLALMRLVSALLFAATVAFTVLFLREIFPGTPWAPVVGGLVVAFQPLAGFLGGVVNNDNAVLPAAAASFWLVACMFRRGLDPRAAALVGVVAGVGAVAKPTVLGLLPGIALGVLLLAWRIRAADRPLALRSLIAFVAACLVPIVLFTLVNDVVWHRGLFQASAAPRSNATGSLNGLLSYLWQWYLPRVPGLRQQLGGFPLWDVWFQGMVGRFGWQDTDLPGWSYWFALGVAALVLAAAGFSAVRERARISPRVAELVTYAVMAVGLLALVHLAGYRYLVQYGERFEQARYLLSLLPVYGALIVLAARAAGRRLAPALGALFVMLAIGHTIFSLLVVGARYYA